MVEVGVENLVCQLDVEAVVFAKYAEGGGGVVSGHVPGGKLVGQRDVHCERGEVTYGREVKGFG